MGKPIGGISSGDAGQGGGDGRNQRLPSAGLGTAQKLLHLAPHRLDGIQVRRIRRQESHRGPGLFDQRQRRVILVGRKVVHHHDVSGTQRRTQHLPNIDLEHFRIGRPFDGQCGGAAVKPDGGNHGGGPPVSGWCAGVDTFPSCGPAPQPGQVRFRPRFIEEDQPGRIPADLLPLPAPPRPLDVGPGLFAGAERLFLYVSPSRFKT